MKKFLTIDNYDDMIHMPRHISPTRPQMPVSDRAAQFSPFAALTGYEDAVKETARLHNEWVENQNNSHTHSEDDINEWLP